MLTLLAASLFAPLPKLTVNGPDLVDTSGKRVLLKGCNLGNWFVIEPWMLCLSDGLKDQHELEHVLGTRFGAAESERLMDLYRSSWITERDFPIIRSFGMNLLRLPMNYRLMEDDSKPFQLKPDAWKWVDRAIDMAEKHGIYTILDMHGVQGGQSEYDHTGHAGQNKLWTVSMNRDRLAWLWTEIAKRYRDRSAVVAYDVFNEPYGGSKPDQVAVFKQCLRAIRKADPDKLVYAMGNWDDFAHYGDPKKNGWHNVGFQMHYYPGLFGGGDPTLATHARHLRQLDLVARQVKALNVPFLVGEMNVVFRSAGGGGMMRRTFDKHASFGWATTMWSYKALSVEGGHGDATWGMVTNRDAATKIDFKTAALSEIERYMSSFAHQPYEVNADLREALTSPKPKLPRLPLLPSPMFSTHYQDRLPGWTVVDLGGSLKGGLRKDKDRIDLFGGGADVWGALDQCRYIYQSVSGDHTLSATLTALGDVHGYSKGGLMLREALRPDAATVLLTAFPSGELQMALRERPGDDMKGVSESVKPGFPVELRLTSTSGTVIGEWRKPNGEWKELGTARFLNAAYAGLIALSHDNRQLVKASYSGLRLNP